ncbi:MAG TPA: serine hydrolase domain-containing protein [Polyangiaceae bacterium]|nr:serine hydrolase domain-containing protein [Polyangiaceae bacterium]
MRARLALLAYLAVAANACSRKESAPSATRSDDASTGSLSRSGECDERRARLEAALASHPRRGASALLGVDAPGCPPALLGAGARSSQPFRMASVAKTFVATLALRAVARGALSLDAPLPAAVHGPATGGVTLRALLQHTSGLFPYERDATFLSWASTPTPRAPDALLARALAHTPRARAGAPFLYANTNYVLLARVLERSEGAPLGELIRRELTGPLGLADTAPETGREPLLASTDARGRDLTRTHHPSWLYGAGDLVTTLSDLVRWTRLYGTGAVIPARLRAEWLRTVPTDDPGVRYGLGVFVTEGDAAGGLGAVRSHAGDVAGLHLEAVYFVDLDAAVVAVVTRDGDDPEGLAVAAGRALRAP